MNEKKNQKTNQRRHTVDFYELRPLQWPIELRYRQSQLASLKTRSVRAAAVGRISDQRRRAVGVAEHLWVQRSARYQVPAVAVEVAAVVVAVAVHGDRFAVGSNQTPGKSAVVTVVAEDDETAKAAEADTYLEVLDIHYSIDGVDEPPGCSVHSNSINGCATKTQKLEIRLSLT